VARPDDLAVAALADSNAQMSTTMNQIKISSLQVTIALLAVCGTHVLADTTGRLITSTPILNQPDLSGELEFPQFDASLGNLTQVELDLFTTFTTSLAVENTSASSSIGGAKTQVQVTVEDLNNNFPVPAMDLLSPGFTYRLGAGQRLQSGPLSTSASYSQTYTLAAILSEFTGPGTIGLSASSSTLAFRANSGGNTVASQATETSLTGDVVYTYTPYPNTVVPEPPTLGLSYGLPALAFGALTFLRRKKL
jgi:hypothetical protein